MALNNLFCADVPLRNYTLTHSLAVDGWAVTFGTARRGLGGTAAHPGPSSLYPMRTAHPSTASVPTYYYCMWHYVIASGV